MLYFEESLSIPKSFDAVVYPAHIDRMSNGIIAILGTLPPTPIFNCVEFHSRDKIEQYRNNYDIEDKIIIVSSDAHYLTDMRDRENCFKLSASREDPDAVRRELFCLLGKRK